MMSSMRAGRLPQGASIQLQPHSQLHADARVAPTEPTAVVKPVGHLLQSVLPALILKVPWAHGTDLPLR